MKKVVILDERMLTPHQIRLLEQLFPDEHLSMINQPSSSLDELLTTCTRLGGASEVIFICPAGEHPVARLIRDGYRVLMPENGSFRRVSSYEPKLAETGEESGPH